MKRLPIKQRRGIQNEGTAKSGAAETTKRLLGQKPFIRHLTTEFRPSSAGPGTQHPPPVESYTVQSRIKDAA
ncbi:hypothetical protein J2T17_000743 [Paenibacillus mucilaginosus]